MLPAVPLLLRLFIMNTAIQLRALKDRSGTLLVRQIKYEYFIPVYHLAVLSSSLQRLQMDVETAHFEILCSLMELIVGEMRPGSETALIARMYARNCARLQIVRRRRAQKNGSDLMN